MRRVGLAVVVLLVLASAALAQFLGYGPSGSVPVGQGDTTPSSWQILQGDCVLSTVGAVTCTKTNGTPLGTMAVQNANAVAVTGGSLNGASVTGLPAPVSAADATTKQYVDNTAAGLTAHTQARLATAAALPANIYNNGAAGVGATLTASANAALSVDGVAVVVNDRVVVKNEAAAANNGVYVVTATGSGAALYVLTRAADANTPGVSNPNAIGFGTFVFVVAGSANLNTGWSVNSPVTTIGTSAINWTQFSGGGGVTSLNALTGGLMIVPGAGLTVSAASSTVTIANRIPTTQKFLAAGTATYTTPANVLWLEVEFVGGGGGGGGGAAGGAGGGGTATCWSVTPGSCVSPIYQANGGGPGSNGGGGFGGGLSGSGTCLKAISGGGGGGPQLRLAVASSRGAAGGAGGNSALGGGGSSQYFGNGTAAAANSGSGGGGGGLAANPVDETSGGGGGSGGYCYVIIPSPVSSYFVTVGSAGASGPGGGAGFAGGSGGSAGVWVTEH
jgi:hypothetical protein